METLKMLCGLRSTVLKRLLRHVRSESFTGGSSSTHHDLAGHVPSVTNTQASFVEIVQCLCRAGSATCVLWGLWTVLEEGFGAFQPQQDSEENLAYLACLRTVPLNIGINNSQPVAFVCLCPRPRQ